MRLSAGMLFATCAVVCGAAVPVDFERDVRPLLSDRCYSCHGPDEATRKVGLRLDTEEGAKKARGPHTPVVPGNPAASEILRRVAPAQPAMRMPPPYSDRKPLTEAEVATLRAWIEQGAKWQSHWSFVPPKRPELPAVRDTAWVRNPIDRFILARLEREGLSPSPETDRARLLRRVSLDLIGLPPTLAELDSFLADRSPDAYEKAVDRLLASPRYGERMAVDWLDAARYADTDGYQVDPEREMWPWRDWVIRAFNRNLPYDRFTIEQLAGDLLPNATLDQKIATGFQRNHRINSETGAIAEEFQAENLVDRVSTMGAVWLGLTVGCARCHDHKYDPITSRDFYSLCAFFNNVDEVGNGGPRDGRGNHQPWLRLPAPELEAQAAAKEKEIAEAKRILAEVEKQVAPRQAEWETGALQYQPRWEVLEPANLRAGGGVVLRAQPDGSILASGAMPPSSMYEFTASTRLTSITGFRLELLPDPSLPGGGSGRGPAGKGVVTLFEVKVADHKLDVSRITADFQSEESELNLVIHPADQLKRGWSVQPETTRPHYAVIEPARMFGSAEGMELSIRIGNEYEGAPVGRFRVSVTDSEFPEVMPGNIRAILLKQAGARSDKDAAELHRFYLAHPRERRLANEQLVNLEAEKRTIENKIPSTMVMHEMATPRDNFRALARRLRSSRPEGHARGARLPAAAARGRARQSPGARRVAHLPEPSAHRARGRKPLLAGIFRDRPGQDGRGLRFAGRSSQPSGTARLAGHRIRPHRVGHQGHAAPDRDVGHLPPAIAGAGRVARTRSGESAAGARPATPLDRRDDPRPGARRLRIAQRQNGRPAGEALSARRPLGAALGVSGPQALRAIQRPRPVAAQCLHLLEAHRAAALHDGLRRAYP